MDSVDRIISQLQLIAEELNDVAMGLLTEAISSGAKSRPVDEKHISQARRAVEKAVHTLQRINTD